MSCAAQVIPRCFSSTEDFFREKPRGVAKQWDGSIVQLGLKHHNISKPPIVGISAMKIDILNDMKIQDPSG